MTRSILPDLPDFLQTTDAADMDLEGILALF